MGRPGRGWATRPIPNPPHHNRGFEAHHLYFAAKYRPITIGDVCAAKLPYTRFGRVSASELGIDLPKDPIPLAWKWPGGRKPPVAGTASGEGGYDGSDCTFAHRDSTDAGGHFDTVEFDKLRALAKAAKESARPVSAPAGRRGPFRTGTNQFVRPGETGVRTNDGGRAPYGGGGWVTAHRYRPMTAGPGGAGARQEQRAAAVEPAHLPRDSRLLVALADQGARAAEIRRLSAAGAHARQDQDPLTSSLGLGTPQGPDDPARTRLATSTSDSWLGTGRRIARPGESSAQPQTYGSPRTRPPLQGDPRWKDRAGEQIWNSEMAKPFGLSSFAYREVWRPGCHWQTSH